MAALTAEQAALLLEPNHATVATLNPDGSAQLSLVWVDWDGEHAVFNTAAGRAKPRNLERDPRCSLLVVDGGNPYRWVGIVGRATLSADGADAHIDALARKYTGRDWTPRPDERRLVVRVRVERVNAYGFD